MSLEIIWDNIFEKSKNKDGKERAACRATRCIVGEIAPYVLLPGDPERAKMIADEYFDDGELVMMNREFHSYTGTYKGLPVSVISTGLGSPGAAMVMQDMPKLGVKAAIRVGTCGTPDETLKTGDIIVATGAVRDEGASKKHLPDIFPAVPDLDLTFALVNAGRAITDRISHGVVHTSDGFSYPTLDDDRAIYSAAGVRGFEMECSAVMILGQVTKVPTACILSIDGHTSKVASGNTTPDGSARDRGLKNAITAALDAFVSFEATNG